MGPTDTVGNIFGLGGMPETIGLTERNPLSTHDINGVELKRNRYGQRMQVEDRLVGMAAGQLKGGLNMQYQKQNSSNHMADCFKMGVFADDAPAYEPSQVSQVPVPAATSGDENQAPIAMDGPES